MQISIGILGINITILIQCDITQVCTFCFANMCSYTLHLDIFFELVGVHVYDDPIKSLISQLQNCAFVSP